MEKRLQRNSGDAVLGGVASGLANYLKIDKAIVRVLWIASLLLPIPPSFFWTGALYLILWLVLPDGPVDSPNSSGVGGGDSTPDPEAEKRRREQAIRVAGIALLGFGGVMLMNELPIWYEFRPYLWPIGLIAAGGYLLLRQRDERQHSKPDTVVSEPSPAPSSPSPDPTPLVLFDNEERPAQKDEEDRSDDDVIKVN